MITAAHYASLSIYVLIMIFSIDTLRYLRRAHKIERLKIYLTAFLITAFLKSLWFLFLQIDWVATDKNDLIGMAIGLAWLQFDYFNGLTTLCFVMSIRVYLRWQHSIEDIPSRRRRSD
jgi:hypothetical protein